MCTTRRGNECPLLASNSSNASHYSNGRSIVFNRVSCMSKGNKTTAHLYEPVFRRGDFLVINYGQYNHYCCTVLVVEVPETLENKARCVCVHNLIQSCVKLSCTAPWYSHTAIVVLTVSDVGRISGLTGSHDTVSRQDDYEKYFQLAR